MKYDGLLVINLYVFFQEFLYWKIHLSGNILEASTNPTVRPPVWTANPAVLPFPTELQLLLTARPQRMKMPIPSQSQDEKISSAPILRLKPTICNSLTTLKPRGCQVLCWLRILLLTVACP